MTDKNENFDLKEFKNDSREIDELFEKFPAPSPSPALVDDIKRKVQNKRVRIGIRRLILKSAAVAAAVLIAWTFMSDNFSRKADNGITEQSVFSQPDEKLEEFETEIALLRNEFFSVCLNEESQDGILSDTALYVEGQIIETDNSFWKG